jgi:hypothetical protein
MADVIETANLRLKDFLDKLSGLLHRAKIEIVTDRQLHQEPSDSFSCSVVLKQGEKELPPEKIYVIFSKFPMIKFFGRTWTEFQGEQGITPVVTQIQDRFSHIKA